MPRFSFDVSIKSQLARDDEGFELDSLDTAEHEAIRTASQIVQEDLSKGDISEIVLHIRDEQGQQVLRIAASMTVQRMNIAQGKHRA